ncbi:MAG: TetR/AcrR family transcriptional regulator [Spirochaetales bacterium]|nr:TetR/AcrR family transcriptional regulator [Spirochaetales bacterium]
MPRIFKDTDKAIIREKLVIEGKKLLQRYGLKKTSIEELARSAGIAKGTFYHFFESKEDLCFAIFDREEEKLAENLRQILTRDTDPARTIKKVIAWSLEFISGDSLLVRLRESGEYELLARGVSPEKLAAHLAHDVGTAALLKQALIDKGAHIEIKDDVLAGVLRAIVLLALQKKIIGDDVYSRVMELMIAWITDGLMKGKRKR